MGYTAIGAAKLLDPKGSGRVTTVEYDVASIEMCAYNPYSQGLFDHTLPIDILQGDSCELIKDMKSSSFDVIIHDPPARVIHYISLIQYLCLLRHYAQRICMAYNFIMSYGES